MNMRATMASKRDKAQTFSTIDGMTAIGTGSKSSTQQRLSRVTDALSQLPDVLTSRGLVNG
jgi:hypothetical protein